MNKRKEIYLALEFMVKTKQIILTDKDIRQSFAKLAREYNCDYRTVKRAYEKVIMVIYIFLFSYWNKNTNIKAILS